MPKQGLDDVRGWGSLQALCTASHQANVGRCRLSKAPRLLALSAEGGSRLRGVAAASSQLTCTPSTVLSYLATSNLQDRASAAPPTDIKSIPLCSTQPGLSRQTYFDRDTEMKGVWLKIAYFPVVFF